MGFLSVSQAKSLAYLQTSIFVILFPELSFCFAVPDTVLTPRRFFSIVFLSIPFYES